MKKRYAQSLFLVATLFLAGSTNVVFAADHSNGANGAANPTDGTFGLGAELGDPSGIVAKLWRDKTSAFDFGFSYSFSSFALIYTDYLYHFTGAFKAKANDPFLSHLTPYVGIGAELFLSTASNRTGQAYFNGGSTVGLGARIPLGLEWLTPKAPIGLFLELVPGIGFIPGTFGFLEAGLGARYYF